MADAVLKVGFAGPLVTVQDAGRFGHLRYGAPASGPMDRFGYAVAQAALGHAQDTPAIEVSLGGLTVSCVAGAVSCAVAGGGFVVTLDGIDQAPWSVFTLEAGMQLRIRGGDWGSWAYLAFAGDLQATRWLGLAATHALSGFGGGALAAGQELRIQNAMVHDDRIGALPLPDLARPKPIVEVVKGPQDHYFEPASVMQLFDEAYRVSSAFDRMGLRLDGQKLKLKEALAIPSEPILRGAVQVSGDGVASVLLADHGTTGGYPKIACVVGSSLDAFVHHRSGDRVRFAAVSPAEAVALTRKTVAKRATYLTQVRVPRGRLETRLMRENLVSGVTLGDI